MPSSLYLCIILKNTTSRMKRVRIDLFWHLICLLIGTNVIHIKVTVTPSISMALRSLLLTRRWETVRVVWCSTFSLFWDSLCLIHASLRDIFRDTMWEFWKDSQYDINDMTKFSLLLVYSQSFRMNYFYYLMKIEVC